jgi:hypothetical protein
MTLNILEYNSFINEAMDPRSATANIIEIVTNGMGWIDPDYAIEMFTDLTGIPADDQRVDTMLSNLADLDLLYYEDESVSNKKGKRVNFGEIELKEYPHKAPDDSQLMGKPVGESLSFRIKRINEFS